MKTFSLLFGLISVTTIVFGQNKNDIKMEQRLTTIGLGVNNLQNSIDFYENKLGWKRSEKSNDAYILFEINGMHLALYSRTDLAKDATVDPEGTGFRGFAFSYAAKSKSEVDDLINSLRQQGVRIIKEPQLVFWGGYSSYIADPDDNLIEIAYHPDLLNY